MPMRPVLSVTFESHVGDVPFIGLSALLRRSFAGEDVSALGRAPGE